MYMCPRICTTTDRECVIVIISISTTLAKKKKVKRPLNPCTFSCASEFLSGTSQAYINYTYAEKLGQSCTRTGGDGGVKWHRR